MSLVYTPDNNYESYRLCRRLTFLRELAYEQTNWILPRSARASGATASADDLIAYIFGNGANYGLYCMASFKARDSAKCFRKGNKVSALTLISNHVLVNTTVISPNEYEGHFALDLLYKNSSDIQLKSLATDTHGGADFALSPRKASEYLKSLRTEDWARLKPEGSVLSGEDYLKVWKRLSGECSAFEFQLLILKRITSFHLDCIFITNVYAKSE